MVETTKFTATGRRKEAVARIRLFPGKGQIIVNHKMLNEYFIRETDRIIIRQPLEMTNSMNKYDIYADVRGGGLAGQAGAVRLGIARVLSSIDASLKEALRKGGFLTRDPRMKERKKYGRKGARKRFQWTKR
jgi:small subunit ribosomal protein S9